MNTGKSSFRRAVNVVAGVLVVGWTAFVLLAGCAAYGHTDAHSAVSGVLPNPQMTPGASDPRVTQANIQSTICRRGYSKSVRPPTSYTSKLKRAQIIAYGYTDRNPRHYEEDHLVSIELGGALRDPRNLWPEPGASPNLKDATENRLHREVCSGQISLATAQHEIATNWTTAR